MISAVRANKRTFKHAVFKEGLNIVLAKRTIEATKRDSTNGLGKSALLEIINFCLGGKKGATLSKGHVDDWEFTVDMGLGGSPCSATRSMAAPGRVELGGRTDGWPVSPRTDAVGRHSMPVEEWKTVLGALMYGLEPDAGRRYAPSFRSLAAYRVRTGGRNSGYLDPFSNRAQQQTWDRQISTSYLLGLGWEFASRRQDLRDREGALRQLKAASDTGVLAEMIGSVGELEARKIRLGEQAELEARELAAFRVHEQYGSLESRANEYADRIRRASDENVLDKGLLDDYREGVMEVPDADADSVRAVYEDAGMVLPHNVVESIEAAQKFHRTVVVNRREFLSAEIERVEGRIGRRTALIASLSDKKAELMRVLDGHGALEEFHDLQASHQSTLAELGDVKTKLENVKRIEEGKNSIKIDGAVLLRETKSDLSSRRSQLTRAVLTFNAYSRHLYQKPGDLTVDVGSGGYEFDIKIERSSSQGFENMKVFCYDLMLAALWSKKAASPPFLVHDSTIFADVDSRQIASALTLAERESRKHGFQYICTINHDSVPHKDLGDLDFDGHVRLSLTDATSDGGLFGFRM